MQQLPAASLASKVNDVGNLMTQLHFGSLNLHAMLI